MEQQSTQHTMPMLHHEGSDALLDGSCGGMCVNPPPPLTPIWVEVDWAGGAIICEGLKRWPKMPTWAVCGLGLICTPTLIVDGWANLCYCSPLPYFGRSSGNNSLTLGQDVKPCVPKAPSS